MKSLIVVYDNAGRVIHAFVEDVLNEATRDTDGGLILSDGRLRMYSENVALFDVDSNTYDILAHARDGKYVVVNGELCVDEEWVESQTWPS